MGAMHLLFSCLCLLLVGVRWQILALPSGAPESVCDTMLPAHANIPPSNKVSPYRVMTSLSAMDPSRGQPFLVKIIGEPEGVKFGGFMLQARNAQRPDEVVGQFTPIQDGVTKLMSCPGGLGNTVTHHSPAEKTEIIVQWIVGQDFEGDVIFRATVAQSFHTFWVGVDSAPVRIARGASSNVSFTYDPFAPTTKRSPYMPEPVFAAAVPVNSKSLYDGCNVHKTCFGLESGCLKSKTCSVMVTVTQRGETHEFELFGKTDDLAFVAVGLSSDTKMGTDLVTACVKQGGSVKLLTLTTIGSPDYGAKSKGVPQNKAKMIESSSKNGEIHCKFTREDVTTVDSVTYNLLTDTFYLLLAAGTDIDDTGIGYHDVGRIASDKAILLSDVHNLEAKSNIIVQLHGIFMVIAWMGTASAAIMLARYFKGTWVGKQHLGKELWFFWHRFCATVTVLLTVVGFVTIFVEVNGWSKSGGTHAIFGVITTILSFVQSSGALFRPNPEDKKRIFFNWGHWLGGNLSHLMSIVTIFFAVRLQKAQLPEWVDWILVAYVVLYCLTHAAFSFISCLADRQHSERRQTFQMGNITQDGAMQRPVKMEAPFSNLRQTLLIIFCGGLVVLIVTLIIVISLSPIK